MADALVVSCPECKKKFKPKTDVRGKRIKCPFCKEPFVVPGGKAAKAEKEAKAEEEAAEALKDGEASAPAPPAPPPDDEFGDNPDPYGVKFVEMVPRCPNCTTEMGPHDIICLACGYNTLTRQWGQTKVIKGLTFGRHLVYLLPALGAAAFTFFAILFLIFYATVAPYLLENTMFSFMDSEAMRMWTTVLVLGWVFGAGTFCFKKFIDKPKPDEIELE